MSTNKQALAELTVKVEEMRTRLARNAYDYNWLPLVSEVMDWDPKYIARTLLELHFIFSDLIFRATDKGEEIPVDLQDKMFLLRDLYSIFDGMVVSEDNPFPVSVDLHIEEK